MKLLIDEQTPVQFADVLRFLLPAPTHIVQHVNDLGWKSKKDQALLVRRSRMHHIRYVIRPSHRGGFVSVGLALAGVAAVMPILAGELASATGQRLVRIAGLSGALGDRCEIIDPKTHPPRYWRG